MLFMPNMLGLSSAMARRSTTRWHCLWAKKTHAHAAIAWTGGPQIRAQLQAHLAKLQAGCSTVGYLSLSASDKGSYKEQDVLDYLDRHLEDWTPSRDWRILLLDADLCLLQHAMHCAQRLRAAILYLHIAGLDPVVFVRYNTHNII